MSDVPTASTSRASTSSASTSQTSPYTFRLGNRDLTIDIDCTTTDESDVSSDEETDSLDEESTNSNDVDGMYEESDDNMDDSSTGWSSTASTVSFENKSSTGSEKSILKESNSSSENSTANEELPDGPSPVTPLLIFVQVKEIALDVVNVEEHTKRLKDLEKELDFIEATEWMFRPIDSSIR